MFRFFLGNAVACDTIQPTHTNLKNRLDSAEKSNFQISSPGS